MLLVLVFFLGRSVCLPACVYVRGVMPKVGESIGGLLNIIAPPGIDRARALRPHRPSNCDRSLLAP